MIINDLFTNKKTKVSEGMAGKVVFSGTGADGGTYEIIQSSPTDFMIHANGRHIDTYGSLQRAMSVLKNEVQGLQKGMAENNAVNVPPGQQATTQPDGSTRISKPGSVSRADYAKNMAAYKAQTQTPEKIADFKQRMASGQGYTDTERQANLQQQQQHFGKFADTGDLDEGDGFDDVSNYQNMRTTDTGNKSNQTYTSTAIAKNPATGQQKSLASWDHTDPKTGKNYSGTNYIDPQGNAEVQKNYEESQDQLDELDKKTVASWVRQQPKRIKGDTGLSRTNFKKAKRLVDKSIPSALSKIKDPGYGQQEPRLDEVSLGDYRKKAQLSQAGAKINKFFDRDDPAAVASADQTIAKREKGLARADARRKPYTAPPVDQDKQRRDLAHKYPNIDELVRQAELRRDPQYDRADGPAYYDGRDAEHNYHRLKQIQRMIRGAELDEMNFGGVNQTTDSDTGDITTSFNQGPMSVSQTKTPGGYTKQTDQQVNLGTATLGARTVGPNIGASQLAGTTTKTATNNMTGQAKQQVKGVGFGGASGATVGKNYVGSSDDELAKYAADSATGINEEPGQVTASVPGASFTANKSTNTLSATTNVHGVDLTATRNMTPGGAKTFSASTNVAPNLNMTATQKSADYNKGQLAGTKAVSANYTDTTGALGKPGQQHTATRTAGVGFGGASGAKVGKNYVDQYSVNESMDRIQHLAGIKPVK
jgi:hypothetical protein